MEVEKGVTPQRSLIKIARSLFKTGKSRNMNKNYATGN